MAKMSQEERRGMLEANGTWASMGRAVWPKTKQIQREGIKGRKWAHKNLKVFFSGAPESKRVQMNE